MSNPFGNLSKLKVDASDLVEYTLYQLEGEPTIRCRIAGEANRPYYTALLKMSARLAKRLRGRDADAKTLRESRSYDVTLFPKHVIDGWDDDKAPIGVDGERVPYTQKDAASFVESLAEFAPDVFDEWRTYVSQTANFRPDEPTKEDGKDLGER